MMLGWCDDFHLFLFFPEINCHFGRFLSLTYESKFLNTVTWFKLSGLISLDNWLCRSSFHYMEQSQILWQHILLLFFNEGSYRLWSELHQSRRKMCFKNEEEHQDLVVHFRLAAWSCAAYTGRYVSVSYTGGSCNLSVHGASSHHFLTPNGIATGKPQHWHWWVADQSSVQVNQWWAWVGGKVA